MDGPKLRPEFDAEVTITVKRALLTAAGPLSVDPVVHVNVLRDSVSRRVASTKRKLLCSTPEWGETLKFCPPKDFTKIIIEVEDSTLGTFLGAALCPFSLKTFSSGQDRTLMLVPRECADGNLCGEPSSGSKLASDLKCLQDFGIDDFGFILIDWDVALLPNGGPCAVGDAPPQQQQTVSLPAASLIRCQWLTAERSIGSACSIMLELGDGQKYNALGSPCNVMICSTHKSAKFTLYRKDLTENNFRERGTVDASLPLSFPSGRTYSWAYPVRSTTEQTDCGVLLVEICIGLDAASSTATQQQVGGLASMTDESIARSTERRWRRRCVVDAAIAPQHLRHCFDAQQRMTQLNPSLMPLLSSFYAHGRGAGDSNEWRELMIAMCFCCRSLGLAEGCRFAFACARREYERAISISDVVFILENCLLPNTLEMSAEDLRRRVLSTFVTNEAAESTFVSYEQYEQFFVRNYSLWAACGVPFETQDSEREEMEGIVPAGMAASAGQGAAGSNNNTETWRQFTFRVIKTGRAFAVTAHKDDTMERVKRLVEPAVCIPAARQRYTLEGTVLDDHVTVAEAMPMDLLAAKLEISITEAEDILTILLVYRAKGKKWEHRIAANEKVLKLRGTVQQKTMMPLSRIVLMYCGELMWDRHSLDRYKLTNGSVVEICSEEEARALKVPPKGLAR